MNEESIDQLYSNLRYLSYTEEPEWKKAISDLTNYLLGDGHYESLVNFESQYGKYFLLPHFINIACRMEASIRRVVDLGCGLGWLGDGLHKALDLELPPLLVDKRPWTKDCFIFDLEQEDLCKLFDEYIKEDDLIVCSELIHCLDNVSKLRLIDTIKNYSFIICEFGCSDRRLAETYDHQCILKGCSCMTASFIQSAMSLYQYPARMSVIGPWAFFVNERREQL